MSDEQILEQIKAERGFIHDLATPLMIAHGMVDAVLSKMDDDEQKNRLEKAFKAMEKMSALLKDRRQQLILRTEEVNK